jgi:hypothetical protein
MRNVQQAAGRRQENIPAGESQFRRRPQNPFLSAAEYQFGDATDYPRRARRLQYLKRQVCRAFALKGMDRTAAEIAQFTGLARRTVERTILLLQLQGFLSNVRVLPARDRNGKRLFKRERMLRKLNPQALLPFNVAVCYAQSGGDNTPKILEPSPEKHVPQDTPNAQTRASGAVVQNEIPTSDAKPNPTPAQLFDGFANDLGGEDIADGILGWAVHHATTRHNAHEPVRNAWAYYRAAIKNFLAMEQGCQDSIIGRYSFCHMFKLPRPEAEIWRNEQREAIRYKLDYIRNERQRAKLLRQLREL